MSQQVNSKNNKEAFRDSIATISKEGKRSWIHPKKPSGKYYKYRTYVSWLLLTVLFTAPFVKINGNQFLLFNVLERKFNIFGFPFWPQDFYLVVLAMIIGVIFVVLFTVIYGRIFCGWMCPQTIFLEMVFRKIEYWLEGDAGAQKRLDKQPWNFDKIRKRGLKHVIFIMISFLISNVFLAYVKGSDYVIKVIQEPISENLSGFVTIWIFTGAFYFVFSWFREQVCIIACPYGRLQGVLLDNKSILVAYDYLRGEGKNGRAKFRKNENRSEAGKGACIDCDQCVAVCPTGIDIRNGTQLECVNCTACIDACDFMMEKTHQEKGLIRYASEEEIAENKQFEWTIRTKAYSVVLALLVGVLITLLSLRNDIEANIYRIPGELYEHKANDMISNVFTYKVVNKTIHPFEELEFKLLSHKGMVKYVGEDKVKVEAQHLTEGTLFIEISKYLLEEKKEKIKVGVYHKGELIETTTTNFLSPKGMF